MADIRTRDEQRASYVEKTAWLYDQLGDDVSCHDFYREVFPDGSLQDAYKANPSAPHDGKYVAIANVIHEAKRDGHVYRRNHYVTDDLGELSRLSTQVAFVSPCSFLGGAKDLRHLRFVHALVVDLDYVDLPQLRNLMHQAIIGYVPTPTFVVNSGTGMHLYYVFDEPQRVYPSQQPAFAELKRALIDLCWNDETSRSVDRQYSGIVQPYRIVGSRSKLDCDDDEHVVDTKWTVRAWRWGGRWTVGQLAEFRPSLDVGLGGWRMHIDAARRLFNPEDDPSRLTREKAKRLYPDWYHERIELGVPARPIQEWKWHVKPAVYEWWLRRIRDEAVAGHRYSCIMCLAVYALKCDVPWERLREDAYGLYDIFEARTDDEKNHFRKTDIEQALRAYRQPGYVTFPNASISYFSGLRIEKNRRNGRKQEVHLARARAMRDFDHPNGSWREGNGRPKGSGTKRDAILAYVAEHPEANHSEIARALGISRPTVIKWLRAD